jgi:cytoskeletal protein RodZ
VKGFIQSYARFLEIPAAPLLEQFKVESANTVRRDTPMDRYLDAIPKETVVPNRRQQHEIPRNVWIAAAAGVVLIALVLCGITQCMGGSTGADTTPTTVPGSGTSASPGETSTVESTSSATQGDAFTLRISARAGMASAVKATVDGFVGFEGTMQGGESREFLVSDRALLVIGNPDAVVVTRDGEPVTVPSTPDTEINLSTGK